MSRNRQVKHKAWEAIQDLYKSYADKDEFVWLEKTVLINAISKKLASPPNSSPENYMLVSAYMVSYFVDEKLLHLKAGDKNMVAFPVEDLRRLKKGKTGYVLAVQ